MQDRFNTLPNSHNFAIKASLVKAFFIGTQIEHPVHYRPYQFKANSQVVVDMVHSKLESGEDLGPAQMSQHSGQIMGPTDQSQGTLMIPDGWKEHRFSVQLEFIMSTPTGTQKIILTGYTNGMGLGRDSMGIGRDGVLAKDLVIYLNSCTVGKLRSVVAAGARRNAIESMGSRQVLAPVQYVTGMEQEQYVANRMLRPTDTLRHCQLYKEFVERPTLNGVDDVVSVTDYRSNNIWNETAPQVSEVAVGNGRSIVTKQPPMVNDETGRGIVYFAAHPNVLSGRYLSEICTAWPAGDITGPRAGDDPNLVNKYGSLAAKLDTATMQVESLFNRIRQCAPGRDVFVTVGELEREWPEIHDDRVKEVMFLSSGAVKDKTNYCEDWGGANLETGLAHVLCQAIPAFMASILLSFYSFNMTNRTIDGSMLVTTTGYKFLSDVANEAERLRAMEASLQIEVANYIISSGVSDFHITMSSQISGSNEVAIMINNGRQRIYGAPAYCDSLYSPMLGRAINANGESDVEVLSRGIRAMLEGYQSQSQLYRTYQAPYREPDWGNDNATYQTPIAEPVSNDDWEGL